MRRRYRLIQRQNKVYYFHDNLTGKRISTETTNHQKAKDLLFAKNQAAEQPSMNLAMARTFLSHSSPQMVERTWKEVMQSKEREYERHAESSTVKRWRKMCRSEPFAVIQSVRLIETASEHFQAVLDHRKAGTSTNVWLRILHNYALDMGWLLAPVLPRKAWPKVKYKEKRGISACEHHRILEAVEGDLEWVCYLKMLWETGGAQSDIVQLSHERLDWEEELLLYRRAKTQNRGYEFAKMRLGDNLKEILQQVPSQGLFFPNLAAMSLENRSRRFRRSCERLGIKGVSLHSYRYAWAERAAKAGMPLRASMSVLGHQSRAVHQAYAKKAEVDVLPLEYYERKREDKIIEFSKYQQRSSSGDDTGQKASGLQE